MTEDRFRALASAYGADLERWPQAERAPAAAFLAAHAETAAALLAAERALDDRLAADNAAEPAPALRSRVILAAPRQRTAGRRRRWFAGAGLGLGLAASCAAGVAAGFALAPQSLGRLVSGAEATPEASSLADPFGDPADS